ncbi:MAG: hypothetical protein LBP80_08265 [Treponema sp.]|nr:hypothetical protein [Treponema sp.]
MKRPAFAALVCLACFARLAAVSAVFARDASEPRDPYYLLPQTVYVGDTGRLALPLGTAFSGAGNVVLDRPEQLPPGGGDLVISRVEIENRGGRARLLVDFTAYVPGTVAFPPIKIGSFVFPDLEVNIASILDAGSPENSRVLSPYAPPVPVPGTMELIYTFVLGIVVLIMGSAALGIWGLPWFFRRRRLLERRRMIRGLSRTVRQLRAALAGDSLAGGEVLDRLNGELRRFLEFFTGRPCVSMTPGEFLSLAGPGGEYGPFLSGLFGRCDRLRFDGGQAGSGEVLTILDEVLGFAETCEKGEKTEGGEEAAAGVSGGGGLTPGEAG